MSGLLKSVTHALGSVVSAITGGASTPKAAAATNGTTTATAAAPATAAPAPAAPVTTHNTPIYANEQLIRNLGYTGAFGAGGAESWLDSSGNRATYNNELKSGNITPGVTLATSSNPAGTGSNAAASNAPAAAQTIVMQAPVDEVAQDEDPAVLTAEDSDRMRRLRGQAENNTLVTGGLGLTDPASTASKTLLGQ